MLSARLYTLSTPFSGRVRVMLALWVCFACITFSLPSHAKQEGDIADARIVITDQIAAFRRDDSAAAYAHASPTVRTVFPSPAVFMEMVRTGYPAVYRPQHYSFEPARWRDDGRLLQPVRIEWSDGDPLIAVYILAKQPDGSWKIDGVFLSRDDRIAA